MGMLSVGIIDLLSFSIACSVASYLWAACGLKSLNFKSSFPKTDEETKEERRTKKK